MTTLDEQAFLDDLLVAVSERAEADELPLPTAFTAWAIDLLESAGEFDEGVPVSFHRRGVQLDGFAFDELGTVLTLIVADFTSMRSMATLPITDARSAVRRAISFYEKAAQGLRHELEAASRAFDAALEIEQIHDEIQSVRIVLITDRRVKGTVEPPLVKNGKATVELWDVERLRRLATSGRRVEAIRVDLERDFNTTWPALPAGTTGDSYEVYLTLIPGVDLAAIYDVFGPRLLELNVRSFLQARGKVNKGIRDTILNQPERFLAYNNGITATAGKVRLVQDENGAMRIAELHELQIVNGGQTSASLHRAMAKDKADLSEVQVMAKITVMPDPDELVEFVPLVSRYSNSQNKVSEADFNANDDFHVQLEKLSRAIWAPAPGGGTHLSRWFYERARGQYNDEIGRLNTQVQRKKFRTDHPSRQKFTKTDVAKFVHTWDRMPDVVSLGAQKNFLRFQELVKDRPPVVDERYFQLLVAKGIIFRETERIVSSLKLGGYRANVVTYTLALLNKLTENRLNLEQVWKEQGVPEVLADAIRSLAPAVFKVIANPPGSGNATEWAKKATCWEAVQRIAPPALPREFWTALASVRQDTVVATRQAAEATKVRGVVDQLTSLTPQVFFAAEMFSGVKLTTLESRAFQNVAFHIGGGERLSRRDAERADAALKRAVAAGFDHDDLGPYRRV